MTETFTPQVGAFFGSSIPGLIGQLIRVGQAILGDWSVVSHAGLYVGPVDGVPSCVEARGSGVLITPLAEVMTRRPLVWEVDPIDPAAGAIIASTALASVGAPYGWLTYAEFLADEFHVKAPRLRSAIAHSTSTICSQEVMRCKLAAGVQLVAPGKVPGSTCPGDLANSGTVLHVGTGPYVLARASA